MGDHPPITPMVMATEADLDSDSWRIYDYVTRHFLGSVSPDCVYRRMKAAFSCGGETFSATGTIPVRPGFTAVMPWRVTCSSSRLLWPLLQVYRGVQGELAGGRGSEGVVICSLPGLLFSPIPLTHLPYCTFTLLH